MSRGRSTSLGAVSAAFVRIAGATAAVLGLSCFHAAAEPQASALMRKEAIADVQALRENPAFADSLEIVVKFRDDGKVKHIVDAFWRDPEVARARFDVFKQGRPEMAAAVLLRVTYSNELVLAYPCKTATKAQHAIEARDVAAKLMASPDIAYAEPNLSFQTQG